MISSGRILKSFSLIAILTSAGCAGQQNTSQTPSGTYSVTYDNVGGLIGFHTGKGRLVVKDGSEYGFKADGYNLVGLGYSVATATGIVFNPRKPEDLSGEYGAIGGAAILGHSGGKADLKNRRNDVMLGVDSDERGLRFDIGGGFVTFKLGDRLKAPRVAAVESPKPVPVPAPRNARYASELQY